MQQFLQGFQVKQSLQCKGKGGRVTQRVPEVGCRRQGNPIVGFNWSKQVCVQSQQLPGGCSFWVCSIWAVVPCCASFRSEFKLRGARSSSVEKGFITFWGLGYRCSEPFFLFLFCCPLSDVGHLKSRPMRLRAF